jgi:hypothetical protein
VCRTLAPCPVCNAAREAAHPNTPVLYFYALQRPATAQEALPAQVLKSPGCCAARTRIACVVITLSFSTLLCEEAELATVLLR